MPAPTTNQQPTTQATTARRRLAATRLYASEHQQLLELAAARNTTISGLIRAGLLLQGFRPVMD